ncbi:unnamed protein product [Orchesella dallaii]|uniref:Uncharacterized protein n=1 Tax=Orchesella dallaii TaxID=48710 RepID=A0ABP1Q8K3_9HEXA
MKEIKGLEMVYFFAIFLIIKSTVYSCPDFETVKGVRESSSQIPEPKLVLKIDEPKKNIKKEKFVHQLAPNIVLVNMTGVLTLRLDCWAPYPIDLKFYGHLTNQETTVKTFRKEFGPVDNPKSCFLINATMESFEEITGNYTCVSVENPKVFSSYYIFVSPTPPGVILTRGQKIIIQPTLTDKSVTFPCAVSHPDVSVHLFKENDVEPLNLSDELLYDPKVGFTMKLNGENDEIFGSYTCKTELSPNDHVKVTLVRPKNFIVHPTTPNILVPPHGQLNVTCEATEDFYIVTVPKTIPVASNEVHLAGNTGAFKYIGNFISNSLAPYPILAGYVSCKWKSNNETFARWTFRVLEKETSKVKVGCPSTSQMTVFECSNSVECRINSCIRKDPTCQSNGQICVNDNACMQGGLIQCITNASTISEIFFTGFPRAITPNKKNRYSDWEKATTEELLRVKEVPRTTPSKRNTLELSCQGSNFVFSSGFKWFIVYENGKKVVVTDSKEIGSNSYIKNIWKDKKSMLESTLTIFLNRTYPKISSFECSAPIWNSWTWINSTFSIDMIGYFDQTNFSKPNASAKFCLSSNLFVIVMSVFAVSFSFGRFY